MLHRISFRLVNMTAVLSCWLALTLFLSGSWQTGAQASAGDRGSPASGGPVSSVRLAAHTPAQVLDGRATRLSHYNPEQKLRLTLAVQPPHMAEEEQFLTELQTKGSPNFHKFLSADEWNARFGPSVEDEQKVVDWAESVGFTVTNRFANRLLVDVEAPAGVIEEALGVTINNYQVDDEVDFSNDRDPLIPSSLTGILSEIAGLNSIQRGRRALGNSATKREPDYVAGPVYSETGSSRGDGDPAKATLARAAALSGAKPDNSAPTSPIAANGYIDPAELYSSQMYNYYALYGQGHCCNVHNDSTGSPADTSIALITYNDFNTNNVTTFFTTFGLAWNWTRYAIDGTNTPGTECLADTAGCTTPGYDGETDLDLSYSTATANSFGSSNDTAHVYVYEGVNELYSTMEDNFNFVLSDGHAKVVSSSWSWPESSFPASAVTTLHGIFNSMVGQGITLIDDAGDNGATAGCTNADAVMFPASDPNIIAAGGTTLTIDYSNGNYVSEVAWTGGNTPGDCSSNGGGGGGGYSTLFRLPSWQQGLPGAGAWRMLPDFSLKAGGYGQAIYGTSGEGGVDGTSIVAPELAGFFAQENAYLNYIGHICGSDGASACEPIGNPNPVLYEVGAKNNAAHYPFYDITQGCNSNYYTMPPNTAEAFCAGPGYDQATGWGSANMLQLAWALNWEIIPASGEPYITWSGPATNKWYNTNQTVSWTIHDWEPAGSTPGSGIAGETQGWDSIPSDPEKEKTPGAGNSFYSGPQFPNGATGCLAFEPNGCSGGVSQGCHTAWARGWNNQGWSTAGNSSYPESYGPICYDTVPPQGYINYTPQNPAASGWFTSPISMKLSATDPGGSAASGVANIYYGINSNCTTGNTGACSIYSSPLNLNEQGIVNFTTFDEDKAGNFNQPFTQAFLIDYTPPVTTAFLSGGWNGEYWESIVTVTLSATDNASGVAATYYTLDGGPKTAYTKPFTIATIGTHTLTYWSVDVAGNTETKNVQTPMVASATAISLSATPNPSVNGQNVKLSASVVATDPGTPTGMANFYVGSTLIGSAKLSKGAASLTTSKLPVGNDTLSVWFVGTSYFLNSYSANLQQTVNETTTTTLSATPNPEAYGSSVTLKAQVKPSISGTPTGLVSFYNGGTLLGSGLLNSSAVASIPVTSLSVGRNSITASYSGDSTYVASKSGALTETIDKAESATAIKASSNQSDYDEPVTFTANVTSAGGTPTGDVTFLANGKSLGSESLADGVAKFTTSSLAVGTASITANYGGTADFKGSSSSSVSVTTIRQPTTTKIASSANTSFYGEWVTFTATVKVDTAAKPGGTVTFLSNGKSIGTGTLTDGVATFKTYQLPVGTDSITASYAGTSDYDASTSPAFSEVIDVQPTSIALKSSTNPSKYGESVTFTATLKSAAVVSPKGTITFLSNGTSIGTGTLTNGVATFQTYQLPLGTSSITASFAATPEFKASTSAAISQVVDVQATTIELKSSPNPSTFGESVTFTATVKSASVVTPPGTVTFLDRGKSIGTGTVVNGVASLNISTLDPGNHSVKASYAGTADYAASTSATDSQVVNAEATSTTVTSSANPSTAGASVTFTATVEAAVGTPSGSVTFKDGTTSLGTKTLASGTATLAIATLTTGTHSITAVFAGSADYQTSTSTALAQTVNAATTTQPALAPSNILGSPGPGGMLGENKQ